MGTDSAYSFINGVFMHPAWDDKGTTKAVLQCSETGCGERFVQEGYGNDADVECPRCGSWIRI